MSGELPTSSEQLSSSKGIDRWWWPWRKKTADDSQEHPFSPIVSRRQFLVDLASTGLGAVASAIAVGGYDRLVVIPSKEIIQYYDSSAFSQHLKENGLQAAIPMMFERAKFMASWHVDPIDKQCASLTQAIDQVGAGVSMEQLQTELQQQLLGWSSEDMSLDTYQAIADKKSKLTYVENNVTAKQTAPLKAQMNALIENVPKAILLIPNTTWTFSADGYCVVNTVGCTDNSTFIASELTQVDNSGNHLTISTSDVVETNLHEIGHNLRDVPNDVEVKKHIQFGRFAEYLGSVYSLTGDFFDAIVKYPDNAVQSFFQIYGNWRELKDQSQLLSDVAGIVGVGGGPALPGATPAQSLSTSPGTDTVELSHGLIIKKTLQLVKDEQKLLALDREQQKQLLRLVQLTGRLAQHIMLSPDWTLPELPSEQFGTVMQGMQTKHLIAMLECLSDGEINMVINSDILKLVTGYGEAMGGLPTTFMDKFQDSLTGAGISLIKELYITNIGATAQFFSLPNQVDTENTSVERHTVTGGELGANGNYYYLISIDSRRGMRNFIIQVSQQLDSANLRWEQSHDSPDLLTFTDGDQLIEFKIHDAGDLQMIESLSNASHGLDMLQGYEAYNVYFDSLSIGSNIVRPELFVTRNTLGQVVVKKDVRLLVSYPPNSSQSGPRYFLAEQTGFEHAGDMCMVFDPQLMIYNSETGNYVAPLVEIAQAFFSPEEIQPVFTELSSEFSYQDLIEVCQQGPVAAIYLDHVQIPRSTILALTLTVRFSDGTPDFIQFLRPPFEPKKPKHDEPTPQSPLDKHLA